MNFYIGVTDNNWFRFLAERRPEEVNFWRPRATKAFRAVASGEPFLFKTHRPRSYIVGGGFFVRQSFLPLSIVWDTFGQKNGAASFDELFVQIAKYRGRDCGHELDPVIGCIILTSPFFFPEHDWIPEPEDWSPNLVQGKSYDTKGRIGASIWAQVQARLGRYTQPVIEDKPLDILEEGARYGAEQVICPRLGQGGFRVLVTEVYNRRCAVTGERTLPVLQAAHIKPYSRSGPHNIRNGLLLRSDLHILFDRGYLTVTPENRVEVSGRIREEYENGKEYYGLQGRKLMLPARTHQHPSREFLEWHNQNVFSS
jgi:putative restriction endonuclease